jgi:hypothetical protein
MKVCVELHHMISINNNFMVKSFLFICFLFRSLISYGQTNINRLIGKYADYSGDKIELKGDSTFYYSWRFDLMSSWSKGTWNIKNDTIYFKTIPVYDTIRYKRQNGDIIDSLVLSDDSTPKLIVKTKDIESFSSGGQSYHPCPFKLFYKHEKLFTLKKNGKLLRRKIRGCCWATKKWPQ